MSEEENKSHPRYTQALFGHEKAERLFLEAFNADRLHHAWLISGPKGVGKATLAWRMAKFLLTLPPEDTGDSLFGDSLPAEATSLSTDPDNPNVQRIAAGGHGGLSLVERSLNEKTSKMRSDIVIDDIRSLIRFYEQTSAEGGWRVAIVDAADEMNSNAANALLKVLEEPPEKSVLFLIAHSPGRLLPTIKSRCRSLPLSGLSTDSIKAVLAARFPDTPTPDLNAAALLADGAPGVAIDMIEKDGTSLYRGMLGILSNMPHLRTPDIHAYADKLAAIKADAEYHLFVQLYLGFLERLIRMTATQKPHDEIMSGELETITRISQYGRLDQWLDLWEKMGELVKRAASVNLDKRQVILIMFTSLARLQK